MQLRIPLLPHYRFKAMIDAHGWAQLSPFYWSFDSLQRIEELPSGTIVHLDIAARNGQIEVEISAEFRPTWLDRSDTEHTVRWMLQLDEDFEEFYAFCRQHPPLQHIPKEGLGPMLRGATVWEDYVKTVCTTNTTWAQTKAMVERIVDSFGPELGDTGLLRAFPSPRAIASVSLDEFASAIRAGYRAPYLYATAVEIAEGRLDLEHWKVDAKKIETPQLMKELRRLRGVGPYGAAHLALLLGSYGYIPVDSWARSLMQRHIRGGQPVTDQEVHDYFDHFGRWKALAFRCWRWESDED